MRAIDADGLKEVLEKNFGHTGGASVLAQLIDAQDTIQPEPHKGHWEPVGVAEVVGGESAMWGSAIAYHVCSECWEQALEENSEEKLSDFCPHCGADMRGEQDE